MVIKQNNKARTYFVFEGYGNVDTFISTSFKGAKQATRLTIRTKQGKRIDLNGRQVNALRAVLSKAAKLSS